MNSFKKLASDTAIYGASSIIGRFLNWWLVPYYSFMFLPEEYGVVTNMYAYVAFLMVLLTYGMETSYFRYASKSKNPEEVYSTSIIALFFTSFSFILLATVFQNELASLIQYPDHPEYIWWFALILSIDAFTAIPFARLRLNNRPLKFAFVKFVFIGFNIAFNLFFISGCPKLIEHYPDSFIRLIYSKDVGVGYVFISNLLASIIILVMLIPEIFRVTFTFNAKLLKQMLSYAFPILIVGLTGMVNQNIDKILLPFLIPEDQNPIFQLGVYGASYKLAVLMNMFIQAFRYAFEPFFFGRSGEKGDTAVYATIMKYFVIFGLLIFLGMVLYLDLIKVIIDSKYHEGLKVVPLVLMANLFYGIYFTQSLWYKLTDKTSYGAYIAIGGAIITLIANILLIPVMGYMGSALAVFVCFVIMVVVSYYFGQKFYPVPYDLKRMGIYFLIAIVLYLFSIYTGRQPAAIKYSFNTLFIGLFLASVYYFDKNEVKRLLPLGRK